MHRLGSCLFHKTESYVYVHMLAYIYMYMCIPVQQPMQLVKEADTQSASPYSILKGIIIKCRL